MNKDIISKRILIYGDSNVWGWIPVIKGSPTQRYSYNIRWPGVVQNALGKHYTIIEDAMSGRTAGSNDNFTPSHLAGANCNGAKYIPALIAAQTPLDIVVIALGTSDIKQFFNLSTHEISDHIIKLGEEVVKNTGVYTTYSPAKVLIVCPTPLGEILNVPSFKQIFTEESVKKSKELASVLKPLAIEKGFHFINLGSVVKVADGIDGVHLSKDSHFAIGEAIANEIKKMNE